MANDWSKFPTTLPGGELIPHLSARMRTSVIDALFTGAGGYDRALSWIEASDENYGEFFKIWSRGAARATNVEVGVSEGVENLLERLDAEDKLREARTINGELIDDAVTEVSL
jgi:hypothetical protein